MPRFSGVNFSAGNDTLDGGAGRDTADFSEATNSVTVDLNSDSANGVDIGSDSLTGIENVITGSGDDTITGDSGTSSEGVEQITIPQGENGLYDVAGRDSITLTMDFLGGEASFNNSFGFYLADESGTPISGEVVKADVKTSDAGEGADVLTFTLNAAQLGGAAQLGLFLIPNGGSLNPDLADGDAVTFADNGYGELQALVDGTPVVAEGGHGPVFFSDASLNGDGVDHESDSELAGNSNWEDLENGGDHDFDDVNWQVDVTTTEVCETGHDDTINGDFGHDTLKGRRGDDSIRGGDGRDSVAGGAQDDRLFGGNDRDILDGGLGRSRPALQRPRLPALPPQGRARPSAVRTRRHGHLHAGAPVGAAGDAAGPRSSCDQGETA